uniref:SH2 domain containing 3Ca n=1 Tax=Neogobius melanostomus TaxID=47308 RepID=A0A8C6WUH0_9GOBI
MFVNKLCSCSVSVSETLVVRNGDFLVRDSLTSVGDYVLTCRWDNEVLHFKSVQYVLESDSFDSVQELVRYYIGQRKVVSQSSGAHIYCPVSRTLPLRYLEATFALSTKQGSTYSRPAREALTSRGGLILTFVHSLPVTRQRCHSGGRALAVVPPSPVMRRSSDPQLSPTACHHPPEHPAHTSHSVHSSSCGTTLQSGVPCLHARVPCVCKPATCVHRFESRLLPVENKPLEMSVLKKVKELLAEADARTTAKHISLVDCKVARIFGVTTELQRMMGVSSGLELLTLPHGHQLRLDLLERFYTMSIMMAVDLLGCTGSTEERAALLHKTIQLAAELKSSVGNMFGFAAVMRALELPQIARLEQTWMTLRQRHTEGAILYEKKLKPFLKNINDGKESSVLSNTTFPHIIPVLSLLERGVALGEGLEAWESTEVGVDVVMFHLEAARTIAHHGGIYTSNAETKLQDFQEHAEIGEIFQTEFQMRLLWGSRGSEGSQSERYEKFDKVLTALSHKLEPPVRQSEL